MIDFGDFKCGRWPWESHFSATGYASALDLLWTYGEQRHSPSSHWQSQWHTNTDHVGWTWKIQLSATGSASALDIVWTLGEPRRTSRSHWQSQWHTNNDGPDIRTGDATPPIHFPATNFPAICVPQRTTTLLLCSGFDRSEDHPHRRNGGPALSLVPPYIRRKFITRRSWFSARTFSIDCLWC